MGFSYLYPKLFVRAFITKDSTKTTANHRNTLFRKWSSCVTMGMGFTAMVVLVNVKSKREAAISAVVAAFIEVAGKYKTVWTLLRACTAITSGVTKRRIMNLTREAGVNQVLNQNIRKVSQKRTAKVAALNGGGQSNGSSNDSVGNSPVPSRPGSLTPGGGATSPLPSLPMKEEGDAASGGAAAGGAAADGPGCKINAVVDMTEGEAEKAIQNVKLALASRYVGEIIAEKAIILMAPMAKYLFLESDMSTLENVTVALIFLGVEFFVDIGLVYLLEKKFSIPMLSIKIQKVLTKRGVIELIVNAVAVNGVMCITVAIFHL